MLHSFSRDEVIWIATSYMPMTEYDYEKAQYGCSTRKSVAFESWKITMQHGILGYCSTYHFFRLAHVNYLCSLTHLIFAFDISFRCHELNISFCDHLSVSAGMHSAFSSTSDFCPNLTNSDCDFHLERKITLLASGVEMLVILKIQDDEIH